jgi:hypothetical protein
MKDTQELRGLLAHHTGSGTLYRHWARKDLLYTEGVEDFIQHAGGGAFWFLDIVMTEPKIVGGMRDHGIVFVSLNVHEAKASITVVRDSGEPPLFERFIPYTDCPAGEWRFYFGGNVLMLPREY